MARFCRSIACRRLYLFGELPRASAVLPMAIASIMDAYASTRPGRSGGTHSPGAPTEEPPENVVPPVPRSPAFAVCSIILVFAAAAALAAMSVDLMLP